MEDARQTLTDLSNRLSAVAKSFDSPDIQGAIKGFEEAGRCADRAFCGSWLGYHSRVYYDGMNAPPAGARFSSEWGFMDRYSNETRGDWVEYAYDDVYESLKSPTNGMPFDALEKFAQDKDESILELREELISILTSIIDLRDDEYLTGVLKRVRDTQLFGASSFIDSIRPYGQFFSQDRAAVSGRIQVPPHKAFLAQICVIRLRQDVSKKLAGIATQVEAHLARQMTMKKNNNPIVTRSKIFLGHGRSAVWRDIKDFLHDRLGLEWDEFNRVPVAGITNIARLSQMLEEACFALVVMTAEDELIDGKLQARMNVIHEAGLFQGRLGFTKAIVLLEEDCEEFSNIEGLGQIHFPKGKVAAAFEEIRRVLEREGVIPDVS